MPDELRIRRIDTRQQDVRTALAELRERLSPRGDIVSASSRQRTIDVFGEPLSPQQVVTKICQDVQEHGIAALLKYSASIDRAQLTAAELRVPAETLAEAHAQASDQFLSAVRRIQDNILQFQEHLVPTDVRVAGPHGSYLRQRFLPLERVGICVPGG
ncbi:MAG: histidinol dehydrogenase, partial [Planctomycetota bacterium]|nr:histidinol dehydrogenase [Planctomycetota bacterium]